MAQLKAGQRLQCHHLAFYRENRRGWSTRMPLCGPRTRCQDNGLRMQRTLRGFHSNRPLSLKDEPSNGAPFNKGGAAGDRSPRIGQRDLRSLNIPLVGRQQRSLNGLWKRGFELVCAAPLQPLKPWEKLLLLRKDGLQACSPLLAKSWAQGRNIHQPYINAGLLLQLLIQAVIIAESGHPQLLQGVRLIRRLIAEGSKHARRSLRGFPCHTSFVKEGDLQSRFGQVIRHSAPYYSCTNHDHVVSLFLHSGLLQQLSVRNLQQIYCRLAPGDAFVGWTQVLAARTQPTHAPGLLEWTARPQDWWRIFCFCS